MRIIVVPGYGDTAGYLERFTQPWASAGHEVIVHPFGTTNDQPYEVNWQRFRDLIVPDTGVVGASFGVSVALRALQDYPDMVRAVVGVAGPHSLRGLNRETLRAKYPQLIDSLGSLSLETINASRVKTYGPILDEVIAPELVPIEGAEHQPVYLPGHAIGIGGTFWFCQKSMLKFLTNARK